MRYTTIRVRETDWKRLKLLVGVGDTLGNVVERLLDEHDEPKPQVSQFTVELTGWEHNELMKHRKEQREKVLNSPSMNHSPKTPADIEILKFAEETGLDYETLRKEHKRIMREQIPGEFGALRVLKMRHKKPEERNAN